MSKEILTALAAHNTWANITIIDFLAEIPEPELAQVTVVPGIYGDAHATMMHIVTAERSYLERIVESAISGNDAGKRSWASWAALREAALRNGQAFSHAITELVADPIQRGTFHDEPYEIRTSVLIVQAIDHATEHRSQIRTLLSANGIVPPEIGGWHWERTLDSATLGYVVPPAH